MSNNVKVAVCAIGKNENRYIREWLAWYKNLGIAKIFLFDNNEIDGERFEDVINDYIAEDFVTIIDVRGTPYGWVYDEKGVNMQSNCYYGCYENMVDDYDWVCFFDIDEFLSFRDGWNLTSFLSQDIFADCGTILVGHETYGDCDLVRYDERPVMERFDKPLEEQRRIVKSIVRTKNKIENKCFWHSHHIFRLKDKKVCFVDGSEYSDPARCNWTFVPIEIYKKSACVLKHYKTKTIEEFLQRNLGRKWGKVPYDEMMTFENCLKHFFKYNKHTPEKDEYLKSIENAYKIENHNEDGEGE